jgi:hypothetical protein
VDAERFEALERRVSRGLLLGGLALVLAGALLGRDRVLSPRLMLAWVAAFVSGKLVLAALGRRAGWPAWRALLAEAGAFICVGWIVWSGATLAATGAAAALPMVACAALLMLGTVLRRRGSDA